MSAASSLPLLRASLLPELPVLQPGGPLAAQLAHHFWGFTLICTLVWLLVMLVLALALLHRRRDRQAAPTARPDPAAERRIHWLIGMAVVVTTLVLLILNLDSYRTDNDLSRLDQQTTLTIRITGHQWWWEVTYEDPQPAHMLTTANEIHIPVGQPVKFKLTSSDVIHSFWVPSLMGKMDLITGRENELVLQADRPGIYQGQCAEFCGMQHAYMRLLVIAEPAAAFSAWQARQLQPAQPPSDPARQRGLQVFLSQPCLMCHQIRGTQAAGMVAPDLTHLASRRMLGAGRLTNSAGNLAAWIVDPQQLKPGVNMPVMNLPPQDLRALLSYLEGLQ